MSYLEDILSEYTRMRDNGADSKAALQALRGHIETLDKPQREELAARIRTWESQAAQKPPPPPPAVHPSIKPIGQRRKEAEATPASAPAVDTRPEPVTWVVCPHCGKNNQQHEVFCYACGQLLEPNAGSFQTKHFVDAAPPQNSDYFGAESVLALRVRGSSQVYEVRPQTSGHEMIVGRSTSGSAITPDIDLNSKQAADFGVSRMHMALQYDSVAQALMVVDLGSANGTFINGQRILPKEVRVLRHGDELRLGKLVLMVSFRHPDSQAG